MSRKISSHDMLIGRPAVRAGGLCSVALELRASACRFGRMTSADPMPHRNNRIFLTRRDMRAEQDQVEDSTTSPAIVMTRTLPVIGAVTAIGIFFLDTIMGHRE
jgi:hypothetical protein